MSVTLENKETNTIIKAPVGISWTVLITIIFLGNASAIAFFRKDYKGTIILIVPYLFMVYCYFFIDKTKLSLYWAVFVVYLFLYIAWLALFVFIYNRLYIRSLLRKGYKMIQIPENYDRYEENDFVPSDKSEEEIKEILEKKRDVKQIALTVIFVLVQILIIQIFSILSR